MVLSFKNLLAGHDTIECAYYLRATGSDSLDFTKLATERDQLRQNKASHKAIQLGSEEFLLASHGTKSGYSFILENDAFTIQCGEFIKPNFYVTYRSIALWHSGADAMHERFLAWAASVLDQTEAFEALGVIKEYDTPALLEERLARMSVSIYGYLKRFAAINLLRSDTATGEAEEAIEVLSERLRLIHDPLTWSKDVKQRFDEIRLGR